MKRAYTSGELDGILHVVLTPAQRKAALDIAAEWYAWTQGTGPRPATREHTHHRHLHAVKSTSHRQPAPPPAPTSAPTMVQRAALEVKFINLDAASDPEPSQHFEPTAHFAWAAREAKRQAERARWGSYLP